MCIWCLSSHLRHSGRGKHGRIIHPLGARCGDVVQERIGETLRTIRLHGLVHVTLVVLWDGKVHESFIVLGLVGVAGGDATPVGGMEGWLGEVMMLLLRE